MRNVFVLTKNEQRVVIVVVVVLLAATLVKHYRERRSQVPVTTSTHPTAAPSPSLAEDEQAPSPDAP